MRSFPTCRPAFRAAADPLHRCGHAAAGQSGAVLIVVILLIAFGSVVAMGLPIVSALIGIGLSLSIIPLVSAVLPTADFTSTVEPSSPLDMTFIRRLLQQFVPADVPSCSPAELSSCRCSACC